MTVRTLIALAALFIACAAPARAGTHDGEVWLATTAEWGRGDLTFGLESIARWSGDEGRVYEAEFGGSVELAITERLSAEVAYLRVPRYGPGRVNEDRLRQQLSLGLGALWAGQAGVRLRAEQRIRGGELGWRMRPRLLWSRPLGGGRAPRVQLSHESFVNLGRTGWGQRPGYERMRNAVTLTRPIAANLAIDVGYLNQFAPRDDAVDHALTLGLAASF